MTEPVLSRRSDVEDELASYVPQAAVTIRDPELDLLGYVVIDRTFQGTACGGLRIAPDVTVSGIAALARGMTLKYGYSGLSQGGAKAGLVGDSDMRREDKHRLLTRFGELIRPLLRTRTYISGPDIGTDAAAIDVMLQTAGVFVPVPRRHRGRKSGYYTGIGVGFAMEACAEALGLELNGRTLAVEGFGSVGSVLARFAAERLGMRVVAASTRAGAIYAPGGLDINRLCALRELAGNSCVLEYSGAERLPLEDLLMLDVDVLSPCAGQYPVTLANAEALRARVICPGSNNPVSRRAEEVLAARGIPSIPYFMANCGGVLGNRMEVLGVDDAVIESFLRRKIQPRIKQVMAAAGKRGELMITIAERYALERFQKTEARTGKQQGRTSLRRSALRVFNSGLVPEAVARRFGSAYFERTLLDDPPVT
jgi:glutamate dehydrogenase (NAD(P)+)